MQNSAISEQEAIESRLKITADNTDRFLEYHEVYSVLICVKYGYAVYNLADHLTLEDKHFESKCLLLYSN
jgi:hypothetical protein